MKLIGAWSAVSVPRVHPLNGSIRRFLPRKPEESLVVAAPILRNSPRRGRPRLQTRNEFGRRRPSWPPTASQYLDDCGLAVISQLAAESSTGRAGDYVNRRVGCPQASARGDHGNNAASDNAADGPGRLRLDRVGWAATSVPRSSAGLLPIVATFANASHR